MLVFWKTSRRFRDMSAPLRACISFLSMFEYEEHGMQLRDSREGQISTNNEPCSGWRRKCVSSRSNRCTRYLWGERYGSAQHDCQQARQWQSATQEPVVAHVTGNESHPPGISTLGTFGASWRHRGALSVGSRHGDAGCSRAQERSNTTFPEMPIRSSSELAVYDTLCWLQLDLHLVLISMVNFAFTLTGGRPVILPSV